MLTAGIDIGSRTIALVECDGSSVVRSAVIDTGAEPMANAKSLIAGRRYDAAAATGYGRELAVASKLADCTITEIKAFALGACRLYPDVRTILDIGGQDSKSIRVREDGKVVEFEMNDRCAGGTGRFLENIARVYGMSVQQFAEHAQLADSADLRLSSTCAVFAESEVISLIGRGEDSRRVAMGVHRTILFRTSAMLRRVGIEERFVFAGGVARNSCFVKLLEKEFNIKATVPDSPQTVGALGAALYAAEHKQLGS